MPKTERWHYDKRVGLVYNVDENGERIGPPKAPSYICRGIEPDKGPLIAAAPELYRAAKDAVASAELLLEARGIVIGGIKELAAAIAKAEGRATNATG